MLRARACGLSDVGVIRSHNEDCFEIDPEHQMFVVADGMGGHSHGEIASRIAVEAIRDFISKSSDEDATLPFEMDAKMGRHANVLRAAIRLAHDRVLKAIRQDTTLHGMGTTVVGLLLDGDVAAVAHVGDSRAYRINADSIEQITVDHSLVESLVASNQITREEARHHPQSNVIYRTIGDKRQVTVDLDLVTLAPGDSLLLCSDGLSGMVTDDALQRLVATAASPQAACDALIDAANRAGGEDNITAIVVRAEALS